MKLGASPSGLQSKLYNDCDIPLSNMAITSVSNLSTQTAVVATKWGYRVELEEPGDYTGVVVIR